MAINLASIVDIYLQDTAFQKESHSKIAKREHSIPTFLKITTTFIEGDSTLKIFRDELQTALFTEQDWGATGPVFLMEINKFVKSYPPSIEGDFRRMLTGLNAANVGQRIEEMYMYLTQAKERLLEKGVKSQAIVAPGNSAFMISLFAFWLDRPRQPTIYFLSLRKGLKILIEAGVIAKTRGLRIISDRVEIRNLEDHSAVQQVLTSLGATAPKLNARTDSYWAESFLLWITENPTVLEDPASEHQDDLPKAVIQHEPLQPTPEPLLTNLIQEVWACLTFPEARKLEIISSVVRRRPDSGS